MLAFFRGTSFISRIIRWRTWGPYSHVGWIENDEIIYESWHRIDPATGQNGPRKGRLTDLHKKGTVIDLYEIALTDLQYKHLHDELSIPIRCGYTYDFRGVLGGFLLRKNQSETDTKMFCSDYIMNAFNNINLPLLKQVPSWKVSPVDLSRSPLITKIKTIKL